MLYGINNLFKPPVLIKNTIRITAMAMGAFFRISQMPYFLRADSAALIIKRQSSPDKNKIKNLIKIPGEDIATSSLYRIKALKNLPILTSPKAIVTNG